MSVGSNTRAAQDLDEIDKTLIRELQNDGRVPFTRLAPQVGLSEAATRQRVNKLVKGGVMQIVAVTDPAMLGIRHRAMVGINVDTDVRKVAAELERIDAGVYLVVTAGRYDILLEIFTTDEAEFLNVLNGPVRSVSGIRNLEILTYLDLVKQTYNWGTG